jgi:hypothetical protein
VNKSREAKQNEKSETVAVPIFLKKSRSLAEPTREPFWTVDIKPPPTVTTVL